MDNNYVFLEDQFTLLQAVKQIKNGMSAEDLLYYLYEQGIIDGNGLPVKKYVEMKYLFHVNEMYPKGGGNPILVLVLYLTPKGLNWLKLYLQNNK